jgi:hypothetical protein
MYSRSKTSKSFLVLFFKKEQKQARTLAHKCLRRPVATLAAMLLGGSAPAPEIAVHFSDAFTIDKSGFATRDLAKPFYFDLLPPDHAAPFRFVSDIGTDFNVWLDKRVPPGSEGAHNRSLAFRITAAEDINVKDKIMLSPVLHSAAHRIELGGRDSVHDFSFDFMLDPAYEVPRFWLVHMQVWQCCTGHPPFTLHVTPGQDPHGPVELAFGVTDDAQEAAHYGTFSTIYRMTVQRGVWNRMAFRLNPQPDGSPVPGSVTMWFNGVEKFDYHGFWGFQPGHADPVTHQPFTSHLGIDVGIYRRRQTGTQIIYFDNIVYGRSWR